MVFGCGTMAGLLVVGAAVGSVRLLVGSVGDDPEPQAEISDPKPRETLGVEKLEICKLIEGKSYIRANKEYRIEAKDEYVDSKNPEGFRVISNSCAWKIPSDAGGSWEFTFSFDAFASAPEGRSMVDAATNNYKESEGAIEKELGSLEDDGELDLSGGKGRYFLADSDSGEDMRKFVLLGQAENAVYEIKLEDVTDPSRRVGEPADKQDFLEEARPMAEQMQRAFSKLLPDDGA